MSEARFDIIDQRFDHMDERFDRMDERMDRMESNLLALRESLARIENALPNLATKDDVAEAMLYARKSHRAMDVSIVAAGVAIGSVVAIFG